MNLTRYIGHLQSLSLARVHLNTTRQERGEVQEENILALIQEAEYQSQCHSLKCCQYHKGSDKQGCMILHTTKQTAWKKYFGQFGIETLFWNRQNERMVSVSYTQIGPVYLFFKLGKKPIKFREKNRSILKKSPK